MTYPGGRSLSRRPSRRGSARPRRSWRPCITIGSERESHHDSVHQRFDQAPQLSHTTSSELQFLHRVTPSRSSIPRCPCNLSRCGCGAARLKHSFDCRPHALVFVKSRSGLCPCPGSFSNTDSICSRQVRGGSPCSQHFYSLPLDSAAATARAAGVSVSVRACLCTTITRLPGSSCTAPTRFQLRTILSRRSHLLRCPICPPTGLPKPSSPPVYLPH